MVVRDTLHHLAVKDQLLEMENSKLKKALYHEKRGTKKKRSLPVHRQQSWEAETEWWSPSRVNRGQRLLEKAEEAEKAEKSRKADTAKLKESSRLVKQQLEADRKVAREEKKERNERRAAERQAINERKAERERQKQLQDQEKAIKSFQRGKRTASQPVAPKEQQKRGAAASAAEASAPRPEPTPPPKTTTRGRNVKLPSKYR